MNLTKEEVKVLKNFLFAHLNNRTGIVIPVPDEWRKLLESVYAKLLEV